MIVYNAIQCKDCLELIESIHRHDYKLCHCGTVSVDGGFDYLKRGYRHTTADYTEMSVDSLEDFWKVRQFVFRISPQVGRVNLCNMSDAHLQGAIDYVGGNSKWWPIYMAEKLHRIENELTVK